MEADAVEGEPEVTVETVPDNIETEHVRPSYSTLDYIYYSTLAYFSNPWALLILAFLFYKLYYRLRPYIAEPVSYHWNVLMEKRAQAEEAARYKRNPDEFRRKVESLENARLRLQEKYERDAQQALEKRQEAEEKRREQEIQEWEDHLAGKGYKNRANKDCDKDREALRQQAVVKGKKGFKPEYNPLMGSGGGGGGYRPAPRSVQRGG